MAEKTFTIGKVTVGEHRKFIIAGPCVVESREIAIAAAEEICRVAQKFRLPVIYKSSYLKANRQSGNSFATLGMQESLRILADVKSKFDLPILTDIHSSIETIEVAQIVDCLQIPAFLCRQTELIRAAARTGLPINIKKGQFMAPENMKEAADKAVAAGNAKVLLTERGTTFGYHDLVVDYRSLIIMGRFGYPIVFDCTHSIQKPGAHGDSSGGSPEFIIPLARAAAAVGVDGLFIETHPDPQQALCDKNCQLKLSLLEEMLGQVMEVWG